MIRLEINNSVTTVIDMTKEQYRQLKQLLLYKVKSFKTTYYKSLITKNGTFPTGLLHRLEKGRISFKSNDIRRVPRPIGWFPTPFMPYDLYPEQKLAVEAFRASNRGIVVAPTGLGKSLIIAGAIGRMKVKTLVVVPSVTLRTQVLETLDKIFKGNVGRIEDSALIAVENIDALPIDPKVYTTYDMVIIDEFHHSAAKTYRLLNEKAWYNIYYRLGLTATAFRADEDEQILLESVLDKIVYKIGYETAVKKKYITPIECYYFSCKKKDSLEYKTYNQGYKEHIIQNDIRNQKIVDLVSSLHSSKKSTLVLVKEIHHGEILQKLLYNSKKLHIPFANGTDNMTEDSLNTIKKFSDGSLNTIIATSIVGEGVDTKPAEYVILAGGVGKSKVKQMQNIGRVARNYPGKEVGTVVVFKDEGHRWFREHFKKFSKMIKDEYNTEVICLD